MYRFWTQDSDAYNFYMPHYYRIIAIGVSQIPSFFVGAILGYLSKLDKYCRWHFSVTLILIILSLISLKLLLIYIPEIDFCVKIAQRIIGIMTFCILSEIALKSVLRTVLGGDICAQLCWKSYFGNLYMPFTYVLFHQRYRSF